MYDIVFISYNELRAEENWQALNSKFPRAKRLHGVKGIHQAHIAAAHMVLSELFYVVDGDAVIDPAFGFDFNVPSDKLDHVHVFRARNPVNDLIYGYGAVKLLPTADVKKMQNSTFDTDMTTTINRRYNVVHQLSNVTAFNTDEFNTWRSAFRECAKLASKIIPGQHDEETMQRLEIWCTQGLDRPYGEWCVQGAQSGRVYGTDHAKNRSMMFLINNRDWLWDKFIGKI